MATKNAVAAKPANSIVSIQEQLKAQAALAESRTQAGTGNSIRTTQDKHFVLPTGEKTNEAIELVIVDYTSENRFYETKYDPKNPAPPACFAIGTNPKDMKPSANSPVPQSKSCTGCPMNDFGSDGDGKACKNTRVLAVMQVDGDADSPMWKLTVSPTAIRFLDAHIRSVAVKHNLPPIGVVTRVSFDPGVTYARLQFAEVGMNPNLAVHFTRQAEATKMLQQEPDVSKFVSQTRKPAKGLVRR